MNLMSVLNQKLGWNLGQRNLRTSVAKNMLYWRTWQRNIQISFDFPSHPLGSRAIALLTMMVVYNGNQLANVNWRSTFSHGFKNRTGPAGRTGPTVDRWTIRFSPLNEPFCYQTGIEPFKPTIGPSNRTTRPVFCKPVIT